MEVQGFPNYLIYPDGRVWANKTKGRKEGFMKTNINQDGYLILGLTNEVVHSKKFRVHRLVAQHYIPNPDNLPEVDHIDRNTLNNDISNLRWADRTIQNRNKGNYKTNTSGHRNVYLTKRKGRKNNKWQYKNTIYNISFIRINKIEVLCYKYIILLRIKARHFH
jgi:hypothetical protein